MTLPKDSSILSGIIKKGSYYVLGYLTPLTSLILRITLIASFTLPVLMSQIGDSSIHINPTNENAAVKNANASNACVFFVTYRTIST